MNLLILLLVASFLTALRDRPGVPLRAFPLVVVCAVVAAAYLSQRVI